MGESFPDGGILHAADPEPGKGFRAATLVVDEPENQLPFPPRIGGADELIHVGPGHQAAQHIKLLLSGWRYQVLLRFGQNGQVRLGPFGQFRVIAAGWSQLHQMSNTPADEIFSSFQIPVPAFGDAQGLGYGLGGRWLFGYDQIGQSSISFLS